jgi:MATE family multidrug resistance protein
MIVMTIAVALTRHTIPLLYLGSDGAANGETIALAAMLLLVGATFFVTDGSQTVIAGALRGLNDTRVPLLIAAFSFWGVGFAAGYMLGFVLGYGAIGVWIGLSIGTSLYAALLLWRFRALTRAHYLPDAPGTASGH